MSDKIYSKNDIITEKDSVTKQSMISHNQNVKTELYESLDIDNDTYIINLIVKPFVKAFEDILEQLSYEIFHGEYGLIICDDASARFPARILYKVIKNIYEKRWFEPIKIWYIKWNVKNKTVEYIDYKSWEIKEISTSDAINQYLSKMNPHWKKVLVFTQLVSSLEGICSRYDQVKDNNRYDLVTLLEDTDGSNRKDKKIRSAHQVIMQREKNIKKFHKYVKPFEENPENLFRDYNSSSNGLAVQSNYNLHRVIKDPDAKTIHAKKYQLYSDDDSEHWKNNQKNERKIAKEWSKILISNLTNFLEHLDG